MRNTDPLTEELRCWGHAQVNRFALSRADRSVHVLDKVRDHAPLTRERAIQDLVGRDGTDRRRLMAAGAGVKGLPMVPLWAADPIRASNDACHPQDLPEIAVDIGIPDDLRWVDRALASMERQHPLREAVARLVDRTPTELPPPMPGLPPTPEQLQQARRLAEAGTTELERQGGAGAAQATGSDQAQGEGSAEGAGEGRAAADASGRVS